MLPSGGVVLLLLMMAAILLVMYFFNPIAPSYDFHSVVCGEWIESVRKDVERLFGALKIHFIWLKSNILYSKVSTITLAVKVCAILHN